ncbi:hypothetical protein BCR36DRAFT_325531 [Piromyces finnis]|uniref:Uncharacterized protein n=1 Tax=Piromyces finnis TaxID=1754191 RepID=A0A1Y1VBW5_9FUNG|nr:hypothetical protein BCR36DRAFT_325531 [Piromyces finnis]|eukprot:ORX51390.1 hypothetical protein BCR36DRAFT_325531 [Piromyces finnis]
MHKYTIFIILFIKAVIGLNYTNFNYEFLTKEEFNCSSCGFFYNSTCIDTQKKEYCDIYDTYYCHKNKCLLENDEIQFKPLLINTSQETPITNSLIIESCDKVMHNTQKCNTRKCNNDSDCFSNICYDNTCITNVNAPLYICKSKYGKFNCLKADHESCERNIECYSSYCDGLKLCFQIESYNSYYRLIVIGTILFVLLTILLCCCFKYNTFFKK